MQAFWNGEIIDEKDVRISPSDLGFLRGYGVFDYLSVYAGKPFMVSRHFTRLQNSARAIALDVPITENQFYEIIERLIEKNNLQDGAIRIVLTGGESKNSISKNINPSLLIRTENPTPLSSELYTQGAKIISTEYLREIPHAKTTHYIEAVRHEEKMREHDAIEILFTMNDKVLECSRSNIFAVLDGALITPKENILQGITRSVVLEEAAAAKIKTTERDILYTELLSADEVFITGTGKKILPIRAIDGQKIASGTPGEITQKLITLYEARTKR